MRIPTHASSTYLLKHACVHRWNVWNHVGVDAADGAIHLPCLMVRRLCCVDAHKGDAGLCRERPALRHATLLRSLHPEPQGDAAAARKVLAETLGKQVRADSGPNDDFIVSPAWTEHRTTVRVILPRGGEDDFLNVYEKMQENVVPKSARQFKGIEVKDGNTLWRVDVFRHAVDGIKKMRREKGFYGLWTCQAHLLERRPQRRWEAPSAEEVAVSALRSVAVARRPQLRLRSLAL
ncbi:ppdK [Symbiodinium microadriaticum]|nr:ppdK [Symbiodinium microadriaticum]